MGIGIAYRKSAIQSEGGFNPDLQVFEYLELSLRAKGLKGVKPQELTVLHLEPESRFSLSGFLRRRAEYGFWYHSLYYLYPKKLSYFAFPVKLFGLVIFLSLTLILRTPLMLIPLLLVYAGWVVVHYELLKRDNPVMFTASRFSKPFGSVFVYLISIVILTLGELAGDLGKLHGMINSPTRKRVK